MDKIRLGPSEMWLDRGVVYVRNVEKNSTHTLEAARESIATVERLIGKDGRCPMILDMTIPSKITHDAQAFYASPESGEAITAMAIVAPNVVARVIGNLILGAKRASMPMKLFEGEKQALEWANQYRKA